MLRQKGLNPVEPKLAYVIGYGLRIGERATLVKSAQERSYGSVIQLCKEELDILYGDESVADYVPEDMTATDFNGGTSPVVSYILPMEKLSGRNEEYAKSLAVVARKIGLPAEYVEEIKTWIK